MKPVRTIDISLLISDCCIMFCTLSLLVLSCLLLFFFPAEAAKNFKPEKNKITVSHCELHLVCLQAVPFRGGHSQSPVYILPSALHPLLSQQLHVLFHSIHKSPLWSPPGLLPATSKHSIPPLMHSVSLLCTYSNHLSLFFLALSSETSCTRPLMYLFHLLYIYLVQIEPQLFNLCYLNLFHLTTHFIFYHITVQNTELGKVKHHLFNLIFTKTSL